MLAMTVALEEYFIDFPEIFKPHSLVKVLLDVGDVVFHI